jgi:replicative DNA helicase
MTGRESAMRSICTAASVDGRKIRTASLDDKDRKKLVDGMARYSQQNLIVDRRTELTVESLGRTIRRLIPKGLQLAVVDHLGLLKPSKQGKGVNRVEQISHQTRYFRLLAREVKIPILVLCQINRQQVQGVGRSQEAGRPQLHQLRESGSIEMDADTVLMIHRPDGGIADPEKSTKIRKVNLDWPAELIVAKQRNGQTTTIRLDWEPQYTRFSCWGCTQVDGGERSENYEPGFDNPPEDF